MNSSVPHEDLSDFYWSLSDAVIELEQRRKSPTLLQQVREEVHLTTELEILFERPHLVMFRQILTPLSETLIFLDLAKKYNLTPFVIEYYDDKFVSAGNSFKRGLGKMPIFQFTDTKGTEIFEYETVVDFNAYTGKTLKEVRTTHDESLIDFHHDLFTAITNIKPLLIARDGSKWFKQYQGSSEYYKDFLKLFVRDNILFETFLPDGAEYDLTHNVVLPAQQKVLADFKVKPLIVQATFDKSNVNTEGLDFYPTNITEKIEQKGYTTNNGVH